MVKSRHILFIVENNSVPRDRRVWQEALAAREFGYDVSVICPVDNRKGEERGSLNGIRIYRHPQVMEGKGKIGLLVEYGNALIWEFILAGYIFIKKPFHVIHAANPPDNIFLIALPYKILGVKFIFDHHDICPENYIAKFSTRGIFYHMLRVMEWMTFKAANAVISTNESYKKIALQRGGKKEKEVFVVRNGPDLTRIPRVAPNEKFRKGFKYLVGYVGVIGQQEGIENLLRAVEYIVKIKNRKDIRFIVVGTGPNWGSVVELSKKMGLERFVWFTGYIPDRELYEILTTVDICVNPEFGNEFTDRSTMIKIMEYMTFGKPIVQFQTAEGEVTAAEAALYVKENSEYEFAETLLGLLEDQQKREIMGAKGRERIEKQLSWGRQKENLRKAYEYISSKVVAS